ncbi:MAG: phosphonate metabolism protein/1,5-bisphosphokinase (PRPP-forming) PhnN [Alphaproteobacteria bacterium]
MGGQRGILFLVAGPSGVGKDSLIDGARHWLADDYSFHFPRRVITRSEQAVGEDHQGVTTAEFDRLEADGAFMLSWQAHGHHYGIPTSAERALANGRAVIVNVSRQIIDLARRRWQPVRVILVSAPREVLAERLAMRGRESEEAIQRRLDRADSYEIDGADVLRLVNAGRLDRAIDCFVALLEHELRTTVTSIERETGLSG